MRANTTLSKTEKNIQTWWASSALYAASFISIISSITAAAVDGTLFATIVTKSGHKIFNSKQHKVAMIITLYHFIDTYSE